jgi:hypothetical protein
VNVPVGLLGIVLASTFLHDPPYMQRRVMRIDVVGIVLLAIGLTALQILLERGERELVRFIVHCHHRSDCASSAAAAGVGAVG